MSAYLKFFELEQSPFEGVDQSKVVLGTQALREAFATIQTELDEGASRVFMNGGPGVGKTSFARALPKLLGDETRVASISDPALPWESLRGGIAMQWGLDQRGLARASLLEAAEDHRLLLVIDQAERATEEFLDHLDVLLSYKDEFADPVVQSVILGQLSGAGASGDCPLVWWLDRIQTLQLEYAPLPREGVAPYIRKHLKRAGWRGGRLFTEDASLSIHGWTGGIPGDVSTLCEQLLVAAADCGVELIDADFVDLFKEERSAEEPWNFDHEFDEFEADEAIDASLLEEHKEDVPLHFDHEDITEQAPVEATGGPNVSAAPAPAAEGAQASATGQPVEAPTSAQSSGLESPEQAELTEAQREEERLASQKAALPLGPSGLQRASKRPKLEETLEHFEGIELTKQTADDASTATQGHAGESVHATQASDEDGPDLVSDSAYLDEGEGFDPNAEVNDETISQLEALEEALSAPASLDELREIRGGFAAEYARPIALGAIAALIGGLAYAFFFGGDSADARDANQTGTPSVLGRVNGPADSMPPERDTTVRLQNAFSPAPTYDRGTAQPEADQRETNHLLARVGPRLKRADSMPPARTATSKASQKRLQKNLAAQDPEEPLTDLRPAGLSGSDLDLSENRNR